MDNDLTTLDSTEEAAIEDAVVEEAPVEKRRPRNNARAEAKGFDSEVAESSDPEIYSIPLEDLQVEEFEYQDRPDVLPHGFFVEGQRLTDVEMLGYDGETDLRIASLYNGNRVDIKNVLVQSLPSIVSKVGGMSLAEIAKASSISVSQLIEQMPLADAIAMLVSGRVKNVGYDISINDKCGNCQTLNKDEPKKGRPYHDIGSLKMGFIKNLDGRLAVRVDLEGGFETMGDRYHSILMRPMRVYEITGMGKMERGKMDWAIAQASIFHIVGCKETRNVRGKVFSDAMYESMSGDLGLKDRNKILKASEELQRLSPQMALSNDCSNCGNVWDSSLNWAALRNWLYDSAD
jgi:hypothetical protein